MFTFYSHRFVLTALMLLMSVVIFVLSGFSYTRAAVNPEMNYQGKLTDTLNMAVPDGTYNMRFWLLTSPSIATTSALWSEELTGTNRVQVTNGLFSVMLGSTSPLTSVDFNQTLYLGVEIGSTTGSAVWDGEMSPRKILGTVPAAFVADTLDGVNSTQFVRTDATSSIAASTADTLLSVTQNGAGDILNLFDGTTEVFSVVDGGNIGMGTTSPSRRFTVQGGDAWFGGNLTGTGTLTISGLTTLADVTGVNATTTSATSTNLFASLFNATNALITNATTTTLRTTTLGVGSDFITDITGSGLSITNGVLSASGDGQSNWLFNGSRLSPSTTVGVGIFASSTIGGGTGATGLTVAGNSTTTLNSYIEGAVGVGVLPGLQSSTKLAVVNTGVSYVPSVYGALIMAQDAVGGGSGARIGVRENNTGGELYLGVVNDGSGAGIGLIESFTGTPFAIQTGSAERFRITATGNIGIGSSTPSRLLTVAGDAIFSSIWATGTASSTYASTSRLTLHGQLYDTNGTAGSSGQVLTSTGTSTLWAAFSGAADGQSNWLYNGSRLSPSTTVGIGVFASSTIGGGTGATGLTISGGATTTGTHVFESTIDSALTAGVVVSDSSGILSASTTIGDGFLADAITISGGTIGSNSISGTLTTTGNLTIGDGGDTLTIDTSGWDVANNIFTGISGLTVTGSSTLGFASSTALTVSGDAFLNGFTASNGTTTNATSTNLFAANLFGTTARFANLLVSGSSTIGGGTGATGLTIAGNSTTTGALIVQGAATSTFAGGIQLTGGCFRDASATSTCIGKGQAATYVVAASNSKNKQYADYIADGTGDQTEINAAIQAAYTSSRGMGGKVYLLEGDYSVNATTTMATGTMLVGSGPGTILRLANGVNTTVHMISAINQRNIVIADLVIDGNRANQSGTNDGIHFVDTASSTIRGVTIRNTSSDGIEFEDVVAGRSTENQVFNVSVVGAGGYGISADTTYSSFTNVSAISNDYVGIFSPGVSNTLTGLHVRNSAVVGGLAYTAVTLGNLNTLTGSYIGNNGGIGVEIAGYSVTVSGNVIDTNAADGVSIVGASIAGYTLTSNNITSNGGAGIYSGGSSGGGTISGNTFSSNSSEAISLTDSPNVVVSGNMIYSSPVTSGIGSIVFQGASTNATVANNRIEGTLANTPAIYIASTATGALISNNSYTGVGSFGIVDWATSSTKYTQWDRTTITTAGLGQVGYSLFSISGSSSVALASSTQWGSGKLFSWNTATSGEVLTLSNNGRLGIGSSTPSRLLTVAGDAIFSSIWATGTASSTYASTSRLTLHGQLYDTNGTAGSSGQVLTSTGTSTLWAAFTATGDGASNWLYNGSRLSPSTTVGIGVFASSTIGGGTGATGLTISGGATTTGNAYFAGNVGIGTSSPFAKLTITDTDGGTSPLFTISSSTNGVSTSTLFTVLAEGDIGIGTTSPFARFSVQGPGTTTAVAFYGGSYTGESQAVFLLEGNSVAGGGDIQLAAGGGNSLAGAGNVSIDGGYANDVAGGGGITIKGGRFGTDSSGSGLTIDGNGSLSTGALSIFTGPGGTGGASGALTIQTGSVANGFSNTDAGDISLIGGNGFSNSTPGDIYLTAGNAGSLSRAGNVFINPGSGATSSAVVIANLQGHVTVGTSTPYAKLSIQNAFGSSTPLFDIATTTSLGYATSSLFRVGHDGKIGLGSTTPEGRFTIQNVTATGSIIAGIKEYFNFANSTENAIYYGDNAYLVNAPNATSTLVGKIIRIEDSTALGNTVRGLEVQAQRGTNTKGENTGISGFGRTFGIRGTSEGDAGGTFVPAGVFAESRGTTQGNALRAYSGTITTSSLVQLFQDTSVFSGTGLLMNFGNSGGSFAPTSSAKFIDLKIGGTSKFTVTAGGTTTIGDGTTANMAGLQIGYGGICVDNDGSCTATTSGRITAVSYTTANSDLAEMYFSNDNLVTGEIVSLQGGLSVDRGVRGNNMPILGVVSTKPGLVMGSDDTSLNEGEIGYPIGLKGRVPVRLSTENGPIMKGDRITLSSIPGVGMKASESDMTVGIALEDYAGEFAYSDGFVNQFADDLVKARMKPRSVDTDTRAQDGCSYGAGGAQGEAVCVKERVAPILVETMSVDEKSVVIAELRNEDAEIIEIETGHMVAVGQAIMFIDLDYHFAERETDFLKEILSTTTSGEGAQKETLWDRLKVLAQNFVDGVLRVAGIKTDELCVGDVCVDEEKFLRMVQSANVVDSDTRDQEETEDIEETGLEPTGPEGNEEEDADPNGASDEEDDGGGGILPLVEEGVGGTEETGLEPFGSLNEEDDNAGTSGTRDGNGEEDIIEDEETSEEVSEGETVAEEEPVPEEDVTEEPESQSESETGEGDEVVEP